MNEAQPAKFALIDYAFSEFSFKTPKGEEDAALIVDFAPSGLYYPKTGLFELTIGIDCIAEGEAEAHIHASITADFHITDNENTVPDFFYRNSMAIIFPYIRAFISTLTLQANDGVVMLPTLNLTNQESKLRDNTTIIAD